MTTTAVHVLNQSLTTEDIDKICSEEVGPELLVDFPKGNNLQEKSHNFRAAAEIKDRKLRLRMHKNCFVGCDVVDTLVNNGNCTNREEAVTLGRLLARELGLFEPVGGDQKFKDEYLLYRFWYHFDKEEGKESSKSNILKKAVVNPVTKKAAQAVVNPVTRKAAKEVKKAASKVANKTVSTVSNIKDSLKGEVSEQGLNKLSDEEKDDISETEVSQSTGVSQSTESLLGSNEDAEVAADVQDKAMDYSESAGLNASTRHRRQISKSNLGESRHRDSRRESRRPRRISQRDRDGKRNRVRRHRSRSLDSGTRSKQEEKESSGDIRRSRHKSLSGGLGLEQQADTKMRSSRSSSSNLAGLSSRSEKHHSVRCKVKKPTSMRRSVSLGEDAHSTPTHSNTATTKRSSRRDNSSHSPKLRTTALSRSATADGINEEHPLSPSIREEEACDCSLEMDDKDQEESERSARDTKGLLEKSESSKPLVRSSSKRALDGLSRLTQVWSTSTKSLGWDCACCGEKNISFGHGFCGMCGSKKLDKPQLWECNSCGTKDNQGRYRFCGGCGSLRSTNESRRSTDRTAGAKSPLFNAMPTAA